MGLEQLLTQRPAQLLVHLAERHSFEHLAHQREPVGVEAARRQPDQNVSNANLLRIPDQTGLDHADYETREVVIAEGIHAWHFRGLAAKKRAAGLAAGRGQALDDLGEHLGIELAGCEVVEEEHGPRAGSRDVVHAVVDNVDADAAVRRRGDRDLDLGPDPIGAGREVTPAGERVEACERTHTDGHLFAVGGGDQRLDSGEDSLVRLDVDARRGVGHPFAGHQRCSRRAGREIRWPGGPDARRGRAPERAHPSMRERGAKVATTQMGRMGAEDPAGISGCTSNS